MKQEFEEIVLAIVPHIPTLKKAGVWSVTIEGVKFELDKLPF